LRAVYRWDPDEDAAVYFDVFAPPLMNVSTLDVIDQLIDHDIFADVVALAEDRYPMASGDDSTADPESDGHSCNGVALRAV
jgi:hypothetical protein